MRWKHLTWAIPCSWNVTCYSKLWLRDTASSTKATEWESSELITMRCTAVTTSTTRGKNNSKLYKIQNDHISSHFLRNHLNCCCYIQRAIDDFIKIRVLKNSSPITYKVDLGLWSQESFILNLQPSDQNQSRWFQGRWLILSTVPLNIPKVHLRI